jgi:DDE_Tnp_1-associated
VPILWIRLVDDVALDCGALGEAVVFLNYFRDTPDHRQRGKFPYPLDEVLLLSLLAVLAGAGSFVDIARTLACCWGRTRRGYGRTRGAAPLVTTGEALDAARRTVLANAVQRSQFRGPASQAG